jgi:ethanolamine transporter EutH
MLAIIVLGAAAGAILGSHFKMFVLGPAILLACFAAVAAGFISHVDAHTIVLGVLATLAALQFGYVVGGVAAAHLNAPAKLPHRTWTPSQYY